MPDDHDPPRRRRAAEAAVGLALVALLVGHSLLLWPAIARFEGFAFSDWGANLTVQALLDRGLRPAVDFHYPYGLLPLALGRLWFGVLGRTPGAYLAAVLVAQGLTALAIARFLAAPWLSRPAIAAAVVAAPLLVPPTHPNLAHASETILLAFALAEQAHGHRGRSLAMATAAALCKPSMAYVYGLILLLTIAAEVFRSGRPPLAGFARTIAPAAVVGAVGLGGLALTFGPAEVLATQVPTEAASLYDDAGYGFFFGNGRRFWWPEGATLRHYLGTTPGYWLAATAALLVGGVLVIARRSRIDLRAAESVATAAALHVAFLCLFFAGPMTWTYYGFVLLIGLGGSLSLLRGRAGVVVGSAFVLLGLLTLRTLPGEAAWQWRHARRSATTAGLWADPALIGEWSRALAITDGRRSALVSWAGAGESLDPDRFGPPVRFFLLPGMEDFPDLARLADRVADAEVIILPTAAAQPFAAFLRDAPAIRKALRGTRPALQGRFLDVLVRDRPDDLPTDVVDSAGGGR